MTMSREQIGAAIQKARLAKSPPISQEALAAAVGKSGQMGGKWERGENEPAPETKLAIAALLGIDPESIGYQAATTLGDLQNSAPNTAVLDAIERVFARVADVPEMRDEITLMARDIASIIEHLGLTPATQATAQ